MPTELSAIQAEYRQRLRLGWMPSPTEVLVDGQRQAGCYFSCLPGDLATLGGVRSANDNGTALAAQLLVSQLGIIRQRIPTALVQAAVEQKVKVPPPVRPIPAKEIRAIRTSLGFTQASSLHS